MVSFDLRHCFCEQDPRRVCSVKLVAWILRYQHGHLTQLRDTKVLERQSQQQ